MDFLPVCIDLKQRACLVVGGGAVASRKVQLLLKAGALVSVVALEVRDDVRDLADSGAIALALRGFEAVDLDGQYLVVAATDRAVLNQEVCGLAADRGLLVNVADQSAVGNVIFPSIIDRDPLQIAISSNGASPLLSRVLRVRLESLIPNAYGRLAGLIKKFRPQVKRRYESQGERRRFWEKLLQGSIAEMVLSGREGEAEERLEDCLKQAAPKAQGEVYLVGAGPGDPDLLTFRALRLMQQADVVVYDRLVSDPILDLTRRDAERIYVGKARANHALRQEEINQLLAKLAKENKRVVRLKGGDPFIFGRGGEEIETLAAEGINFQVVPAITAALGTAAYAGIPLTHRDYAQSCLFVTGHLKDNTMNLNWEALAQPQQTVVVYMGYMGLPILCRELIAHGVSADKPIALVQQATTPQQRVFTGTLATIVDVIKDENVKPPSLIIVGDVVKLQEKLKWFKGGVRE